MSEHFRLTARQSLEHPWLEDEDLYIDVLQELETSWMRACLARRRWHRALNTLKAMHTMKKLTFPDVVPGWWQGDCRYSSDLIEKSKSFHLLNPRLNPTLSIG